MSFDFGFALSILPILLRGAVLTVLATFGGFAGALVGGAIVAAMQRSDVKALRFIAIGFVYVIRNTPLLVQLYFVFYVLPSFGITIGALAAGILGLSLHYSAFIAEVYRAGIGAVPVGQFEAADALGLRTLQKWALVIAPQALKPILPVLGNYLIGMFKETPILATITVIELFGAAQDVAGKTYRYNEPYTLVALIFLAISIPCSLLVRRLDTTRKGA
ncbi:MULTISPECIES: ectoine/hydroxyectoine ABC transporter permease subunit EhuD [unclassified Mesorhizobium]|uniref:ectoine/hydroxyectoine ABC transporter permease subunit EhuD n=1 Tax=unclassified Mesorhizobium TaxID=325217 RepID=UPI00086EF0DA|nr:MULTISPECIES: ectoine/hydroxyectoine ABC transporter permease subunit EhuD [unclassified Mesorhizobium]MBN9256262.1 ectoine/hydroxyectoine ABC transporter permease subunit EhuD [Mesorhizobium sp.]MBN9274462.1 ectoine/hydroxyectoine ABC transporter permease subunit EhuD [Mesorhizobium sp.]ODT12402.1 MAG: ectoine/hydroxyectoine ABC transporter permease subunit EhuD [Mesorhizobium sp. SCN 65-12]OJX80447.1 MAG: ectoine/hydroxyectoine ABC transporter permease subunit EhuD [Mesorhizobium sp. 65-26